MYADSSGRLVVSATDLVKHLACGHVTTLDRQVARGERDTPRSDDELLDLFARGLEHEEAYRQRLALEGRSIVTIAVDTTDLARLAEAEAATVAALEAGADVVYQGTFFDGTWRGHADFLLKRPDRPGRWGWSYDVADTKLARRLSVAALLQMAVYADRLTALQGVSPEQLIVVTGDSQERPFALRECAAYTGLGPRTVPRRGRRRADHRA